MNAFSGALPMKRILLLLLVVAGSRVVVDAHHRLGETYLENREITIDGRLTELTYREPHSFVLVDIRNAQNQTERWIVEGPGAGAWRRAGIDPEVLKVGDRVTVTGHPGRVPAERRLLLMAIVRPQDGWRWTVGLH
jgi:hypothetical protein